MLVRLEPHPDTPCGAAITIEVEVARPHAPMLGLHYAVMGEIGGLLLPQEASPERTDALWQHSCFEAFLRIGDGPDYFEFNFAPSRAWAAYRFGAYREGMASAETVEPLALRTNRGPDTYLFHAMLDFGGYGAIRRDQPWRLGLSTVIEEQDGRKSYWALAHSPGKPDFHHPDCFVLDLPPP